MVAKISGSRIYFFLQQTHNKRKLERDDGFSSVTRVTFNAAQGSSTPLISRGGAPACQKIGTFSMRVRTQYEKQQPKFVW